MYFQLREQAERAAAKKAASPQARRVHQQLAQNYAGLVRGQQTAGIAAEHESRRPRLAIVAG